MFALCGGMGANGEWKMEEIDEIFWIWGSGVNIFWRNKVFEWFGRENRVETQRGVVQRPESVDRGCLNVLDRDNRRN